MFLNFPVACQSIFACLKLNRSRVAIVCCYIADHIKVWDQLLVWVILSKLSVKSNFTFDLIFLIHEDSEKLVSIFSFSKI